MALSESAAFSKEFTGCGTSRTQRRLEGKELNRD
jgi:hypothetical protein